MSEEVSWQTLVGIENDKEGKECSLSPVFHKNRWIVLPKSQNENTNLGGQAVDNRETILQNDSQGASQQCNRSILEESKSTDKRKCRKIEAEEIIYYSPIKTRSTLKRRSINFSLSSPSIPSDSPVRKKSRYKKYLVLEGEDTSQNPGQKSHIQRKGRKSRNVSFSSNSTPVCASKEIYSLSKNSLDSNALHIRENKIKSNALANSTDNTFENRHLAIQGTSSFNVSLKGSQDELKSLSGNKSSNLPDTADKSIGDSLCASSYNKSVDTIKRKLLYSYNKPPKFQNIPDINMSDFYKSAVQIEGTDKMLPPKKSKATALLNAVEDFVPVSSLSHEAENDVNISNIKPIAVPLDRHLNPEGKDVNTKDSSKSPSENAIFNDSLNHFQCTEVEQDYRHLMLDFQSQKKLSPDEYTSVPNTPKINHLDSKCVLRKAKGTQFILKEGLIDLNICKENNELSKEHQNVSFTNEKVLQNSSYDLPIENEITDCSTPTLPCSSKSQIKFNQIAEDSVSFDEILTPAIMFCGKPQVINTLPLEGNSTSKQNIAPSQPSKIAPSRNVNEKLTPVLENHINHSPKKSPLQNDFSQTLINSSLDCMQEIDFSSILDADKNGRTEQLCCEVQSKVKASESSCFTESTDGSKTKVEALLQGILDKPSNVPLQRLLSEDFMELSSTVVQFSTASGSVVRTSQESLDKAKALLQDVLGEEDRCSNSKTNHPEGYSKDFAVSFSSAKGTKIEVSENCLKKAQALFQNDFKETFDIPISNTEETCMDKPIVLNTPFINLQHSSSNILKNIVQEKLPIKENKTSESNEDIFSNDNSLEKNLGQSKDQKPIQRKVNNCDQDKSNFEVNCVFNSLCTDSKLILNNSNLTTYVSSNKEKSLEATDDKSKPLKDVRENTELLKDTEVPFQVKESFNALEAFPSAGGRKIKLSEAILNKAKSLFSDFIEQSETKCFVKECQGISSSDLLPAKTTKIEKTINTTSNKKSKDNLKELKSDIGNENEKLIGSNQKPCCSAPIEKLVINSSVTRLNSPNFYSTSISPATSENLSEEAITTSSQENIFSHNESVFGEMEFSTEIFCVQESRLRKDEEQNFELDKDLNVPGVASETLCKTPVWRTPEQNLRLSSSKKLFSLSTRSRRRNSPVENTTPKLSALRKTVAHSLEKRYKNELQEKIKSVRYKEEAKHIFQSPEYNFKTSTRTSTQNNDDNPDNNDGSEIVKKLPNKKFKTAFIPKLSKTPKNNEFLFNTTNENKVNITKKSLRSAKKQFKTELEPTILHKEAEIIVKSSEHHFKSSIPSEISEQILKKSPKVLGNEIEITDKSEPENDAFELTTAKGREANVSGENVVKTKSKSQELSENVKPKCDLVVPDALGFCTAGGSRVSVSESSLKNVKELFNDDFELGRFKNNESARELEVLSSDAQDNFLSMPKEFSSPSSGETLKPVILPPQNILIMDRLKDNAGFNSQPNTSENDKSVHTINPNENVIEKDLPNTLETSDSKLHACHKSMTIGKSQNNSKEISQKELKLSYNKLNDGEENKALDEVSSKLSKDISRFPQQLSLAEMESDKFDLKNQNAPMFATARGSYVNISKDTLHKVKDIFSDLKTTDNPKVGDDLNKKLESNKNQLDFRECQLEIKKCPASLSRNDPITMFSSARGHPVIISEETLLKVKSVFKEDLLDLNYPDKSQTPSLTKEYQGTSTRAIENKTKPKGEASQETSNIEFKGRSEADEFLGQVDYETQNFFSFSSRNLPVKPSKGISRARNSSDSKSHWEEVKEPSPQVSREELLLPGISTVEIVTANRDDNETGNKSEVIKCLHENSTTVEHCSNNKGVKFSSAKGNEVRISEESLLKVKTLFEEFDYLEKNDCSFVDYTNVLVQKTHQKPAESIIKSPGVNLKNNNPLLMSSKDRDVLEESLQKVKNEIHSDKTAQEHLSSKTCSDATKKSYRDASEIIDVSKLNVSNRDVDKNVPESTNKVPLMFSTAKGTNVNISKEALRKVLNVFKDEIDSRDQSFGLGNLMDVEVTHAPSSERILVDDGHRKSVSEFTHMEVSFSDTKRNINISKYNKMLDAFDNPSPSSNELLGHEKVIVSTSSESHANISEDLQMPKKPFQNELDIIDSSSSISTKEPSRLGNQAFSTAGGGIVNISQECWQGRQTLFKDQLNLPTHESTMGIKNSNTAGTIMFSTASGNNVNISEESLQKVRSQFKDELGISDSPPLLKKNVTLGREKLMFSTASGNNVNISEESLRKVRSQFKDELGISDNPLPLKNDDPVGHGKFMFSTASGNNVNISEESLRKVRSQFKDELGISDNPLPLKNDDPVGHGKFMFSTASGNNVNISEESLRKVRSQFKDELGINDNPLPLKNDDPVGHGKLMISTASENNVNISEESLRKVRSQFKDELGINDNPLPLKNDDPVGHGKLMFSTASGNNVNISEESLRKVRSQFKDELGINDNPLPLKNDDPVGHGKLMISTASENNVNISEESLQKVRSQFKDELGISDNPPLLKKNVTVGHGKFMFSTASGNNVNISEESLRKVRSQFKDELGINDNPPLLKKNVTVGHGKLMFSTASGNNVNISEESLRKVRSQFKDELGISDNPLPLKNDDPVGHGKFMFSTASGNNVNISEESLRKVRSQFKDELGISDNPLPLKNDDPVGHGKFMFSTASGNNVNISEESLRKVRSQFKDELGINDNPLPLKNDDPVGHGKLMFSTASGNNVNISEESLRKVRSQFKDELGINDNPLPLKNDDPVGHGKLMISTASENNVNISEESLQKVRSQFKDELGISDNPLPLKNDDPIGHGKFMFSTASGNNVNISEESLRKVRSQFKNDLDFHNNESVMISNPPLRGEKTLFSTPSEINIKIPEERLKKVRDQLRNDLGNLRTISLVENDLSQFRDAVGICNKGPFDNSFVSSDVNDNKTIISSENLKLVENKIKSSDTFSQNISQSKSIQLVSEMCNEKPPEHFLLHAKQGNEVTAIEEALIKVKDDHYENNLKKIGSCYTEDNFKNSVSVETTPKVNKCNIDSQAYQESLAYTPTLSGQFLNDELNRIEKLANSVPQNMTVSTDKFSPDIKLDSQTEALIFETPVLRRGKPKIRSGDDCTSVSQRRLLYKNEAPDSFTRPDSIEEKTSGTPYVTSSTLVCDRSHLRPLMSWPTDYDSDDDFLAAAETPVKVSSDSTPAESLEQNILTEKRKPTESLAEPKCKKVKLADEKPMINMEEISKIRNIKREEQNLKISLKAQNHPSMSRGLYMSIRNKDALLKFMDGPLNNPQNYSADQLLALGLCPDVINVTSKNAAEFKFDGLFYFNEECFSESGSIDLGTGFTLVLSDDNKVGLKEISATFLSSPDVDPSLCHVDWIKNHYKWIVWKLACLERSFPHILPRRFLVPVNVLHQLKYRYDRELDLVQRPAFRRILECDEPASRRFVACVADIRKVESEELEPPLELELTDGWYSVWSTVDSAMVNLIKKGKVKVGTKLIVHGAELLNCGDGCDPLELKESTRLKLSTNSVRRTKWYSKMGFTKCPGPLHVRLDSLLPEGGTVGLTSAIITRVYPLLFISKDSDGKSVTRNIQAESQFAAAYEREQNSKSEELFEKILLEVENKYKKRPLNKIDLKNLKQIMNPAVLYGIISQEPEAHASLNPEQLDLVRKYHEEVTVKIQGEVKSALKEKLKEHAPPRQVTSLLKIRISDSLSECSTLVTIWRPTEDICSLLTENRCVDFYALIANGMRNKVLQLSSAKMSCYKESSSSMEPTRFQRRLTEISELANRTHFPLFGELDIAGVVVYIKEPEKPWGVTNVYFSDLKNNFLMVTFWTSLKVFGCEELLKEGSIVAAINLHWRQGCGSYIVPSTFVNELTYFSSHTSQDYISKEITHLKNYFSKEDLGGFVKSRKEALLALLKERSNVGTPVRLRDSFGLSPNVAKRLEKLKSYGPAPPLPKTPLLSSPDVRKSFKSPKINKTPMNSNNA